MNTRYALSKQTKSNWLIDSLLLTSGLAAAISGIYFLFVPQGGYRGGRNPAATVTFLLSRGDWDWLHTWGGVAMITVAMIHLAIHWPWVTSMLRRAWRELTGRGPALNGRGRWNLALNVVLGVSAALTAVSGVYFLFAPHGRGETESAFLLSRLAWDLLHSWAGALAIAAAVAHFVIHWRWVMKVTTRLTAGLAAGLVPPRKLAQAVAVPVHDPNPIQRQ